MPIHAPFSRYISCGLPFVFAPLLRRGAFPNLFPDGPGLLFPPTLGRPPWLDELACVRAIISKCEHNLAGESLYSSWIWACASVFNWFRSRLEQVQCVLAVATRSMRRLSGARGSSSRWKPLLSQRLCGDLEYFALEL